MIYAQERGIDYLGNTFVGSPNLLQFEAQGRAAIRRVPEVISVASFDADLVDNRLAYTADIQTNLGAGTINGIL